MRWSERGSRKRNIAKKKKIHNVGYNVIERGTKGGRGKETKKKKNM